MDQPVTTSGEIIIVPPAKVVQDRESGRSRSPREPSNAAAMIDWPASQIRQLRRRLLAWTRRTRREMPWRGVGDAYRVWISEIMLQQTTVAAVIPYYERFLTRFPTLKSLADADEQDVLSAWEGL
jgi:A/G-specific adenine glycosylase